MNFDLARAESRLDREQALDLRRTVFCGELHWPAALASEALEDGQAVLLASLGPKPVGTGRLRQVNGHWVADGLAVLPAFRRRGLGRNLLNSLETRAAEEGAKVLHLASNPELKGWFQGLGYLESPAIFDAAPGFLPLEKRLD